MKHFVEIARYTFEYILIVALLLGTFLIGKAANAEPLSQGRYVAGGVAGTVIPLFGIGQFVQGRQLAGAIIGGTQFLAIGAIIVGVGSGDLFLGRRHDIPALSEVGATVLMISVVASILDVWIVPHADGSFDNDGFDLSIIPARSRKTGRINGGSLQLGMNF